MSIPIQVVDQDNAKGNHLYHCRNDKQHTQETELGLVGLDLV